MRNTDDMEKDKKSVASGLGFNSLQRLLSIGNA